VPRVVPNSNGCGAGVTNLAPSPGAVRRAYQEELGSGQRSALLSWLAFTATFAGLRGLTDSIRAGKGPFRNISLAGEHLHHYMWGIGLQMTGVPATLPVGEIVRRLNDAPPAALLAYTSTLVVLAGEQHAGRLRISPHMITAISELLTDGRVGG
jgi:hypothetical protein